MTISKSVYLKLKETYGICSSWAVWVEEERRPLKASVHDTSIFELERNPDILNQLNANFVFVALNFSTDINEKPEWKEFDNFHSGKTDWKIRHAFMNSPFWGGYMTDFLKNFPHLKARNARKEMEREENKDKYLQNIRDFKIELSTLGKENPLLIAFGREAEYFLRKEFPNMTTVYVPHYAIGMTTVNGKELYLNNGDNYKQEIMRILVTELNCESW